MTSVLYKRDGYVGKDKKCEQRAQAGEKQAVQERTFTKWMNMHLKKCVPPLQIDNLFTDIQDGKVLMALLEELSGCNMLEQFRPFSHRIFRLNNISKVLNFLEDRNVSLLNIDANEIADGNPSAVLKLIWNIMVYYQIKQVTGSLERSPSTFSLLSLPCGSDSSGRSSPVSPGDDIYGTLASKGKRSSLSLKYRGTAIKTLLNWAQNCTAKYGVEIHDFGKCWRSGLAFLALVKYFCPECVDMRMALSSGPRLNMETAFTAAYEWLGIPPLLEPDDIAVPSPDEQSVIIYVAQFLECCPGHEQDSVSTDSSGSVLNSTERWDRSVDWTDSVFSSSVPTEALRGLHNPAEIRQEQQTSDALPVSPSGLAGISEHFFSTKCSSWSNGHLLVDSTGGQCCDSFGWKNGLEDSGKSSEVSKEAVWALSMLDSDEEDAFSYILELDHKETGTELNVSFDLNTIAHTQRTELNLNVVRTLESTDESISLCHFFETQRHLPPQDVPMRSDNHKGADENILGQVLPAMHICTSQRDDHWEKNLLDSESLLLIRTSVKEPQKIAIDECLNFKMKENDGEDDASVIREKAVDEDKMRGSFSENHQYERNEVLDRSALYRRKPGEPTVSYTQRTEILDQTRYQMEELHVLLFLWMIAYCILIYPHLDIFCKQSTD